MPVLLSSREAESFRQSSLGSPAASDPVFRHSKEIYIFLTSTTRALSPAYSYGRMDCPELLEHVTIILSRCNKTKDRRARYWIPSWADVADHNPSSGQIRPGSTSLWVITIYDNISPNDTLCIAGDFEPFPPPDPLPGWRREDKLCRKGQGPELLLLRAAALAVPKQTESWVDNKTKRN
nr:hypothetical protein Iba_chr03aCG12710 [Ipomoea batatas]